MPVIQGRQLETRYNLLPANSPIRPLRAEKNPCHSRSIAAPVMVPGDAALLSWLWSAKVASVMIDSATAEIKVSSAMSIIKATIEKYSPDALTDGSSFTRWPHVSRLVVNPRRLARMPHRKPHYTQGRDDPGNEGVTHPSPGTVRGSLWRLSLNFLNFRKQHTQIFALQNWSYYIPTYTPALRRFLPAPLPAPTYPGSPGPRVAQEQRRAEVRRGRSP